MYDDISVHAITGKILANKRTILVATLLGSVIGGMGGLLSPRQYRSATIFLPQASQQGSTSFGLAQAASQLGIQVPGGGAWGPAVYAQVLHSHETLLPIAEGSFRLDLASPPIKLSEILEVPQGEPAKRLEKTIAQLENLITIREDKSIAAVRIDVLTRWPFLSQEIASALLSGVDRFNRDTRKSQAAAEREYAEQQCGLAEQSLRQAEDEMQSFLQSNRNMANSPALGFHKARLDRQIALRQQVYSALLASREEARLREVRDTPTITVLEAPRIAPFGESRKIVPKVVLGALVAGLFVAAVAVLRKRPLWRVR